MSASRIFSNTDIIRLYAEPFAYNIGSRRVLEKPLFQMEGTLRSNAVKDGRVLDMVRYSCIIYAPLTNTGRSGDESSGE